MKNRILPIIFCVISTLTFAQKPTFNIKFSEQLAVFEFIQNLSEDYPENVFKTEFSKSQYNTEKYKNLISKFNKLSIDYSYDFEEFPNGSKIPMQTRDILKKNLIETENLKDFKIRSIGIVSNKTLSELTEIIAEFKPMYNELIYEPNKEKFEQQIKEITKYSTENKIENYFETGLVFYNSSWDNSIPFEIAFYPLPNSEGFTAQAFYNNFISAIQTNLKDYKVLFSVMLHEIYHIIYNEQSLEVKTEIDKNFVENKSNSSNYAYQLLNEVLATSLGNGYVFEKLEGKIDDGEWYNRKYINLMAKQIYPLVIEYVSQKRSIDKNFIDNYIKQYEEIFPNWINELDNIMTYRYVMTENENDFDLIDQKYRYFSSANYDSEITESGIEKMKNSSLTKLIIISNNNKEKLNLIKREFKELSNWKFNAENEFNHKILLEDKSQLIIINQKKSTTEILLKQLETITK
jgi:hypothetical protein